MSGTAQGREGLGNWVREKDVEAKFVVCVIPVVVLRSAGVIPVQMVPSCFC